MKGRFAERLVLEREVSNARALRGGEVVTREPLLQIETSAARL